MEKLASLHCFFFTHNAFVYLGKMLSGINRLFFPDENVVSGISGHMKLNFEELWDKMFYIQIINTLIQVSQSA